ncbi:MAG: hypothetical protein ABUS79_03670 [Pseudomonadota bacterium]
MPSIDKVFMVRHQAGGIASSHVFLQRPTEEQIAPIRAEMDRLHGKIETKSGKPWWVVIHEAELMAMPSDMPVFPERENDGNRLNRAAAPKVEVSGTLVVTNPPTA